MPFKPHPGSRPGHKPLMTKAGRQIADAIFNASDQRLRRFVVGQETPSVNGQWLRVGLYAWRTIGRFPRSDEMAQLDRLLRNGRFPDVIVGAANQKQSLTVLLRHGHVIEDPKFPGGSVLMLSDRARAYMAMREKRVAHANRRAAWRAKRRVIHLSEMY